MTDNDPVQQFIDRLRAVEDNQKRLAMLTGFERIAHIAVRDGERPAAITVVLGGQDPRIVSQALAQARANAVCLTNERRERGLANAELDGLVEKERNRAQSRPDMGTYQRNRGPSSSHGF